MELRDKRYEQVRLIFHEEGHKYNDTFGNEFISTTTLLHNYAPKFDKDYWLKKKAAELHMSEKRLAEQWKNITDEACKRLVKVPRIFLNIVLKECVSWAKENNVS